MSRTRKFVLTVILSIALLICGMAFLLAPKSVKAAASAESFRIERGAWVRTEDPFGIRFMAKISQADKKSLLDEYGADNVVFGMLICPADYVTDESDLTLGSSVIEEYDENKSYGADDKFYVNKTAQPAQFEDSGDEYFACALVGINEYNYSRPFSARAYYGVKASGSDFVYSYTDIQTCAPYTVASKALNDKTASFDTNVKEYLQGISDYVLENYDSVELTVTNQDGESEFKIGDTVKTEVRIFKSADESKKLETGAKIVYGNAVDETGKVVSLGDFSVTAYLDEAETIKESVTVANQKTFTILDGEDTQNNLVKAAVYDNSESKAKLVWHESYTSVTTDGTRNVTKQNVLQWTINDGQASSKQVEMDLSIKEELMPLAKKDVYLCFDFMVAGKVFEGYWKDPSLLYLSIPSQVGENVYIYNAPATDLVTLYNAKGSVVANYREGQDNCNNWLTAQVKLPADWVKSGYFSLGMLPTSGSSYKTDIFLSNMYLSVEEIVPSEMKGYSTAAAPQKEEFNITEFNVGDSTKVNFSKSEAEIGGRSNVYNYSATVSGGSARLYLSDNVVSKLSPDGFCYLYYDIYVNAESSLCVSVRNGTSSGTAVYINKVSAYSDDNFSLQLYNQNGEKLTTPINSNLNQWITVAVRFKADNIVKGGWGQLLYNTGTLSADVVYLDNLRIANYDLFE